MSGISWNLLKVAPIARAKLLASVVLALPAGLRSARAPRRSAPPAGISFICSLPTTTLEASPKIA